MIKIDDGYIYMSCGGACYCFGVDNGKLKSGCFGKRVEPEDDIVSIADGADEFFIDSGFNGESARDFVRGKAVDTATGKLVTVDFEFLRASVIESKPTFSPLPSLRGEKTVKIELADKKTGLCASIYYTPYTRGAISRTAEIGNDGDRTLSLRAPGFCRAITGEFKECNAGSARTDNAVAITDGGETHGNAYAVMTVYGGAVVSSVSHGGATEIFAELDKNIELAPGERFVFPETLAAYSDLGIGGVRRIFHDVIRAYAVPERFTDARRPIAVFHKGGKSAASAVAACAAVGADAFVVDVFAEDGLSIADVADECKAHGVTAGVRVKAYLPTVQYKKLSNLFYPPRGGKAYFDLAKGDTVDYLFSVISALVAESGVEYISLCDFCEYEGDGYGYMTGLYTLHARLVARFPELFIETVCDLGCLCYAPAFRSNGVLDGTAALLPLCSHICDVGAGKPSLKTEFDLAALGCLSYSADIAAMPDGMRRALRAQVFSYQDVSALILSADLYLSHDGTTASVVSKDKSKAIAVYRAAPHGASRAVIRGIDEHNLYHVRELDKVFSGAAIVGYGLSVPSELKSGETVAFHIRQVADYE